jgi:hypothetical protein
LTPADGLPMAPSSARKYRFVPPSSRDPTRPGPNSLVPRGLPSWRNKAFRRPPNGNRGPFNGGNTKNQANRQSRRRFRATRRRAGLKTMEPAAWGQEGGRGKGGGWKPSAGGGAGARPRGDRKRASLQPGLRLLGGLLGARPPRPAINRPASWSGLPFHPSQGRGWRAPKYRLLKHDGLKPSPMPAFKARSPAAEDQKKPARPPPSNCWTPRGVSRSERKGGAAEGRDG